MRIKHHKTLWIHSAFSAVMGIALVTLILIKQDLPTTILAGLLAAYIVGNTYIHIRRDDLKRDTLYEYILLGVAIFVVVSSAALQ